MAPRKFHQLNHDQENAARWKFQWEVSSCLMLHTVEAYCGLLRELKSLSTWGRRVVCTLGCQSPRERSPSVEHQGQEGPHVVLVERRDYSCSLSCVEAWFASLLPARAHCDGVLLLLSVGKKKLWYNKKEKISASPVYLNLLSHNAI